VPEPTIKTIEFPTWAIWNFMFPEKDVMLVHAVKYYDEGGQLQSLPEADFWRLAIGRNGVSTLVIFNKNKLPKLQADRALPVFVEYEP
jgi:hypothetical protein